MNRLVIHRQGPVGTISVQLLRQYVRDEALLPEHKTNLIAAVYQEKENLDSHFRYRRFQLCEPADKETLRAECNVLCL